MSVSLALTAALTLAALCAVATPAMGAAAQPGGGGGLRAGDAGSYSWAVRAGSGARGAACLQVAITRRRGRFAYDRSRFRGCAMGLKAKGPPLIVGGTQSSGARAGMTVFAIAVAPGVDRVRLAFSDGNRETISAKPLVGARRSAGQRAPRYAVFATPARRCLSKVVSAGPGGLALWADGGGDVCLPELGAAR